MQVQVIVSNHARGVDNSKGVCLCQKLVSRKTSSKVHKLTSKITFYFNRDSKIY